MVGIVGEHDLLCSTDRSTDWWYHSEKPSSITDCIWIHHRTQDPEWIIQRNPHTVSIGASKSLAGIRGNHQLEDEEAKHDSRTPGNSVWQQNLQRRFSYSNMMGLRNTVLNEIDDTKLFMKANNTYTQYISGNNTYNQNQSSPHQGW